MPTPPLDQTGGPSPTDGPESLSARDRVAAAEARAAELAAANAALARSLSAVSAATDFEQILEAVFREVVRAADAPVGFLFTFDPAANTLTTHNWIDEHGSGRGTCPDAPELLRGPFDADVTPAFRRCAAAKDILAVVDLNDLTPEAQAMIWPGLARWHLARGRVGSCAVPIVTGDQPLGMIGLAWHRPLDFTPAQRELLFALTNQVALVLQLREVADARREAAVAREREAAAERRAADLARAADALQTTTDALAGVGASERFIPAVLRIVATAFAAATASYFEHRTGDLIRLRYWLRGGTVRGPDQLVADGSELMAFVETLGRGFTVPDEYLGGPCRAVLRTAVIDHAAGTCRPDIDRLAIALGQLRELRIPLVVNGKADGAVVVSRAEAFTPDEVGLGESLGKQLALALEVNVLAGANLAAAVAKEREAAAEARADELARANAAIRRAVDALAAEPDLDRALGHVLAVMSDHFGAASAALWAYDPARDRFDLTLAYAGGQVIPAADDRLRAAGWPRGRDLAFRRHIADRRPVVYDADDATTMRPDQRAFLAARGVKTLLGVPLLLGDEVAGSFTVRFTDRRTFRPEDLELVQAVAHQAALALRLVRLGEAASRAAVLGERTRLAGDIHDTLAQGFAGIVVHLQLAARAVADPDKAAARIATALDLARGGLAEARRSVWELRPVALDDGDLSAALGRLAARAGTDDGPAVRFESTGSARPLSPAVEGELLRLAQEAMCNAIRHAAARAVAIRLAFGPAAVELVVVDDGRGFDPAVAGGRGFGLTSMRERAARAGGRLVVETAPGAGTKLSVTVPDQAGEP